MLSTTIVFFFLFLAFLLGWRVWQACTQANEVDWGHRGVNLADGLIRLLSHRYHRLRCESIPFPDQGPAVVVANHISGLDPLLLVAASHRPLRFLIAREEYQRFGFRWLFKAAGCIPVDRDKRPELAMREALLALKQGEVVAVFPHGRIQEPGKPTSKIKGGAVRLAQKQGCKIFPVFIDGIRGHGHTMLALPLRSEAVLHTLPTMDCADKSYDECMSLLAQLLNAPIKGVNGA
jgi:1-acyl-sn-glycerol-3-phosphate acyltransferase